MATAMSPGTNSSVSHSMFFLPFDLYRVIYYRVRSETMLVACQMRCRDCSDDDAHRWFPQKQHAY